MNYEIALASQSPRRIEILNAIFKKILVVKTDFNDKIENQYKKCILSPEKYVKVLSFLKAQSACDNVNKGVIIGADTVVVFENKIYEKPTGFDEAYYMLKKLSGNIHNVLTGVTLYTANSGRYITFIDKTLIKFKKLDSLDIIDYIEECKPYDKAGAYGIQEIYDEFIEKIEGSYWNVVGFPLEKFKVYFKHWGNPL